MENGPMNILICPHELVVGGSQINAIELAAAVRNRGHNVAICSPEGPLISLIEELGLSYIPAPPRKPLATVRDSHYLLKLARQHRFDIVHAYEIRPSVLSALGPNLFAGTPVLMTILAMEIPYAAIPRHVPLIVGTRELIERAPNRQKILLMEPPIDIVKNRSRNVAAARKHWSFGNDDIVAAIVCRLTPDLEKLHGVLAAIEAIGGMSPELRVKLLIVGDGTGMATVKAAADQVNGRHGRNTIVVAGQMLDPSDAYEASDIVLGMGSSALKGMAFSKPLVVQGTRGFWRMCDEDSVGMFLHQGWFGHGGNSEHDLKPILIDLAGDIEKRARLGDFGRRLVEDRFSLESAASQLIKIYEQTIADRRSLVERLPAAAGPVMNMACSVMDRYWRKCTSALPVIRHAL